MTIDGFSAPFYRLFYKGKEIQDRVESFQFKESEDEEDVCTLTIRHDERNAPDFPQYQEMSEWSAVWGFIGGEVTNMRKMYLQEVKWNFDDQNIFLTATFTPKAISTKQRSTSQVYTKTSIVQILQNVAKVHGLKAYVEIPGQYTKPVQKPYTASTLANNNNLSIDDLANKVKKEPLQIELTDSIVKTIKDYADKKATKDELDTTLFGSTDKDLKNVNSSGNAVSTSNDPSSREDTRNLLTSFDTYGTIPQANRSDRQLLDELAKRQPDGPFFIDTQADKIILKRRHFDKPSNRTYHWADGQGDLLAFQPESKNRSKKGTAVGVSVGGWDGINKTYHNTTSSADNETQKDTLAKYQQQVEDLNSQIENKDNTNIGLTSTKQFNLAHDASNVVKVLPNIVYFLDKKKVVEDKINILKPPTGNNKNISDPTARNPAQGLTNGGNARRESELKNNPGYIEVIGNPSMRKGQIVTILGASKKYSGNYYIKSVTHTIDGSKAYITTADVVRQGVNIKTMGTTKTTKTINKTVGPDDSKLGGTKIDAVNATIPNQFNLAHDATNVVKPQFEIHQ